MVVTRFKHGFAAILWATLLAYAADAAAASRPFKAGSYDAILAAHKERPFVLVFWSVDCAPCVKELDILKNALEKHPAMSLVLVSTDEASLRSRVDEILVRHGLDRIESWMFGDESSRRLRGEVDESWFGELPRSYFYDARHRRVPLSGGITNEHLEAWVASLGP